jgi:hypothetical protein
LAKASVVKFDFDVQKWARAPKDKLEFLALTMGKCPRNKI